MPHLYWQATPTPAAYLFECSAVMRRIAFWELHHHVLVGPGLNIRQDGHAAHCCDTWLGGVAGHVARSSKGSLAHME